MSDEELIARLRKADEYEPLGHDGWEAADRIEALVKERDQWIVRCGRERAFASSHRIRAERLEAALREIESNSVHSGGEIHGVTALQWELAFAHAQDVASAALKGADHDRA